MTLLYGVLADINGNREALAAVLAALQARGAQRLACLGNVVGYNADPDECAAMLRERRVPTIAGSHDLIAVRRLGFAGCSNKAAYALRRTRRAIAPETAAWLESLPLYGELEPGVVLAHASVREDFPAARVCFLGDGHERKVLEVDGEVRELPGERLLLDPGKRYLINPGSVDASRKNRNKIAQCALFNGGMIEFLQVPYDAAASECKAAAFGYRIPPFVDRAYSVRKRLSRLPQKLAAISSAAARWPSRFQRVR